jgi:cellulose synthase/poly-beta-1,6-N-acetylglucosamine synthase-like glycosyltransferase
MYSIIIPAYNEADRIKNVLMRYAEKQSRLEIVAVFDGQDNTPDISRECGEGMLRYQAIGESFRGIEVQIIQFLCYVFIFDKNRIS